MQEQFYFSYKRAFFKLQRLASRLHLSRSVFYKSLYLLGLLYNPPYSVEQVCAVLYVLLYQTKLKKSHFFFEHAFTERLYFSEKIWHMRTKQVKQKCKQKRKLLNKWVSLPAILYQRAQEKNLCTRDTVYLLEMLDIVTVLTRNKLSVGKTISLVMKPCSQKKKIEQIRQWHSMNAVGWVDTIPLDRQLTQQTHIPFFEKLISYGH